MKAQLVHRRNFVLQLQQRPGFDQPILIKEPALETPSDAHLDQLHNEYTITRLLAGVPGVRSASGKEGTESHPVLLLEYIWGQTLGDLVRESSLDLDTRLHLAEEIARVLARIHDHKVMHKDINSSNVLVANSGEVYLIDFGIATTMRNEYLQKTAIRDVPAGELAYLSPEQTGRTNRLVDYRTDLYSLGAVLYELFTGRRPFPTSDALEMIYCHIARQPAPPHEVNADVPRPISDIILKLLAKNAEDRYQSAWGLQVDLQRCREQLQITGQIEPFELGSEDYASRLQIPAKLYGRGDEINQLLDIFDRVAQGSTELLLVAGYAGVGKTSLVREIQVPVTATGGCFVEGKFDQYQRSMPYTAWEQAFAQLVTAWLTESQSQLANLKADILTAVGPNGKVLTDLLPELELIIGPQPQLPELGGMEVQNRFNHTLQQFIRVIATPAHPLVVFLDDLQWIDLASLNLLKTLLTDPHSAYLLVIGAYRDNEVNTTHPLVLGLGDLEEVGSPANQLTLGNLGPEQVQDLLADSLRMPRDQCVPLAQLIQIKTDGNPFFTHQLLHAFVRDGLLSFNLGSRSWQWDLAEVQKMAISDNV